MWRPFHSHRWELVDRCYAAPTNHCHSVGGPYSEELHEMARWMGLTTFLFRCQCGSVMAKTAYGQPQGVGPEFGATVIPAVCRN